MIVAHITSTHIPMTKTGHMFHPSHCLCHQGSAKQLCFLQLLAHLGQRSTYLCLHCISSINPGAPCSLVLTLCHIQINTMRQQTPILFSSSSSIFIECQRGGILLFFKMCPQNALSSLFLWISSTQKTFSEILLIWNLPASKVPCHPVHGLYHLPRFGYVTHQPGLPHFLSILSACQGKLLADLVKKESCPQRKSWQW